MAKKKLNRSTALSTQRPVKILQFGEGNFLRAFVDWMADILNEKTDFNGDVQIIQPLQNGMGAAINAQEGLYHVILNGIRQGNIVNEKRLITCVQKVINPFDNFLEFLKTAENPDLKFILSNTTEAGIQFLLTDNNSGQLAETFPGKLTTLLYHRFIYFKGATDKGLIIMPCELIEKNGEALKEAILKYAALWSLPKEFKEWLLSHSTFCNTLVDRIVPGFPKETIGTIQSDLGYEDNLVVVAEPFHLWVIEATDSVQQYFPTHKAELDVKFVTNLELYPTRKVRILNGAHTALVPPAYLRGFRTVKDSVDDPFMGTFIRKVIHDEIIPTLDLPKAELVNFADEVMERFQNPFIRHELISIALNSISKFKVRVLPSILRFVDVKKELPEGLLYSLAALLCFYKGEWHGEKIALNDSPEVLDFFQNLKNSSSDDFVQKTLANKSFWGMDLTTVNGLEKNVKSQFLKIQSEEMTPGVKSN